MRIRRFIPVLVLALIAVFSLGALANANSEPIDILLFTKTAGFRHGSIPKAKEVVTELAEAHGWGLTLTEDSTYFTDENLAKYDIVMFASTTGSVLDQADQKQALENFINNGGGYVGAHAAADTHYDWAWYGDLVGAYFNGHPPGTQVATVHVENRDHPSTAHFPASFEINDEWYFWNRNPREQATVLMTLDRQSHSRLTGFNNTDPEGDHPLTWCKPFDGGRSWYTAMGHPDAVWESADFQQMLIGGIEWAAGRVEGDCGGSALLAENFAQIDSDIWELWGTNPAAKVETVDGQLVLSDFHTNGWDFNQRGIVLREPVDLTGKVTTITVEYVQNGHNEQNIAFSNAIHRGDDVYNHNAFRVTVNPTQILAAALAGADGSFSGIQANVTPPYALTWVITDSDGTYQAEVLVDGESVGTANINMGSLDPSGLYFYLYGSNDTGLGPTIIDSVTIVQE